MANTSGITPCGHRILVLPEEVETKTKSGIILHDKLAEREEMAQIRGTVIEVGGDSYQDTPTVWCQAGDRILFAKYAGLVYDGQDGKKYRVINDLDVVAKETGNE
ncbi:MAG: co-chaperone GroES [Patescibacteria group bacterium]|nr:co-chaperone GroES [Patescibacteria group bacterium]